MRMFACNRADMRNPSRRGDVKGDTPFNGTYVRQGLSLIIRLVDNSNTGVGKHVGRDISHTHGREASDCRLESEAWFESVNPSNKAALDKTLT